MQKLLFFVVLFPISLLFAESKGPSGDDYTIPVISSFENVCDTEDFSRYEIPADFFRINEEISISTEPPKFSPLWRPNILVTNQCACLPRENMAFDYDASGNIYSALQSSHNGGTDTLFIYRSTDRGYSWNVFYSNHVANGGKILDFDMRLEPHTTVNPEIYLVWADSQYSSGYRLFFGAVRPGVSERWYRFDSAFNSSDSTFQVAMDVSPDSNPSIAISSIRYAHYVGETGWNTMFSSDTGLTWSFLTHVTSNAPMGITVACHSRTIFYVGTIYTQNNYRMRVAKYDNGTVTSQYISADFDTLRADPVLVTQKYHSYPSNYVYAVLTLGSGNASRIFFNFSSNGGSTWVSEDYWPVTGNRCSYKPNMRIGWNYTEDRPIVSCLIEGGSFDSLGVSLCNADFYTWGSKSVLNDHSPTALIPPQVICVNGLDINGSVVLYRQSSSNNIWFDRWDHYNHIEELPPSIYFVTPEISISKGPDRFCIYLTATQETNIKITVFDVLGRNVRIITEDFFNEGKHSFVWMLDDKNGDKVRSGTYFICFDSDNRRFSKSVKVF